MYDLHVIKILNNSLLTWILLCAFLDAKCDSFSLSEAIVNLEADINTTSSNIKIIETAKYNLRRVIDCNVNRGIRDDLILHYESLCKHRVVMRNVVDDLKIKRNVLEQEKERCLKRSKIQIKLSVCSRFASKPTLSQRTASRARAKIPKIIQLH